MKIIINKVKFLQLNSKGFLLVACLYGAQLYPCKQTHKLQILNIYSVTTPYIYL